MTQIECLVAHYLIQAHQQQLENRIFEQHALTSCGGFQESIQTQSYKEFVYKVDYCSMFIQVD